MSSNEVKNECSSLSHIPRCYWVTSYLSHTETTDFWSESVQFSTESIQDSPIYGRVIKNGPIFGRVNRVKLPHGLGRMTEVGRSNVYTPVPVIRSHPSGKISGGKMSPKLVFRWKIVSSGEKNSFHRMTGTGVFSTCDFTSVTYVTLWHNIAI